MKRMALLLVVMLCAVSMIPLATTAKTSFGDDVIVKYGYEADDAVSFGGDVQVFGKVKGDVVSFGGDVTIESTGIVEGDVVSFGGEIEVRCGASVAGDVVNVGGSSEIDPGASIKGETRSFEEMIIPHKLISMFVHPFTLGMPGISKVLLLGPLTGLFGAAGILIGIIFIALKLALAVAIAAALTYIFPNQISGLANYLHDGFPKALLMGIVATLVAPVLTLMLIVTLIGIPLVPLFLVIVGFAYVFGSVGVALWIGRIIPESETRSLMVNVLLGVLIVSVMKQMPIIGLVAALIFWTTSLGVVVITRFGRNNH